MIYLSDSVKDKIKKINLFLMDVDGVMTDGKINIDDNGCESKSFNVRDGHGIKLLQRGGIKTGIITGRSSKVVSYRANELGMTIVCQGAKNKLDVYRNIVADEGVSDEAVAYIGDDIVDLPVLKVVGFSSTVYDASTDIIPYVDYRTVNNGGNGAVREVAELILRVQGLWDEVTARYFLT